MTAEPLDAILLTLFFVAVLAICLHNWLSDKRKVRDDDSGYSDPGRPTVDAWQSAQPLAEVAGDLSSLPVPADVQGAQVIAESFNGTTQLRLVKR